ncbi:hypothetical protein V6C27_02775 [Peptococcaceae bacterium 1198_IL3148]
MGKRRIEVAHGDRYGKLTVIKETSPYQWSKYKHRMVLCKCDCGNETTVRLEYLRSGHTKSCGCNLKTVSAKVRITHGSSNTRLHGIWAGMLSRCRNKNSKSYKNYGAIGISVCDEWLDFETFQKWALTNGYRQNLTIERIDNSVGYNPGNCTWVTKSEQSKNRRCCRYITYKGKTKIIQQWADELGINAETLRGRLLRGWSIDEAFNTPVQKGTGVSK